MPKAAARKRPREVHAAPAGVISRNISRLVDLACCLGLVALALVLAEAVTGEKLLTPERLKMLALPLTGLFLTLTFAYTTFFHTLYGRTPGKWVTGIRVLDETGRPPRLGKSALRMILAFVSALPLFAGVAAALFSRRRQTLYDKLTGTYVVRLIEVR